MTDLTKEQIEVVVDMKQQLAAKGAAKLAEDKGQLQMGLKVTEQSGLGAILLSEFVGFYGTSSPLGIAGDAMLKGILRWNAELKNLKTQIDAIENPQPVSEAKPQPEEPTKVVVVEPEQG